jgi:RHS repeat-associated protein
MTRATTWGLRALALFVLTLVPAARLAAQDPCMQDDPPPPPECWMVDVSPDGGTAGPHPANTGGYSVSFTVTNVGLNPDGYSISCWGSSGVTCTGTSVSSVTLWPWDAATVTAFYSVGPPGTGTLTLSAWSGSGAYDEGYFTVTIGGYSVAVTPDGGTEPTRPANSSGHTASFTVQNVGTLPDTYTITCGGTVNVTCTGVSQSSLPLGASASAPVTATYSVGAPGTGTVTLTAASPNASNGGSFTVPVVAYGVAVTPDGGAGTGRPKNTSGHTQTFTVTNTGGGGNTYTFSCGGSGGVSCSGVNPASASLGTGAWTTVTATFSVGAPGTGTLTMSASGTFATDGGSYTVPVIDFVPSAVAGSFTKDSRYLLQETANTYNTVGQITQLADARNQVTNFQYGGNVNNAFLTKITRAHDASGPVDLVTDIAYDADQFVQSIKDEGGTFRYFVYDLYGRLTQVKNNAGVIVSQSAYTYSRTAANGWTFQPSSPNVVTTTTYLQQTPTVKSVVSTEYLDGLGGSIQTVVQDGANYHVTATQYDLMGRVWRVWKPYTRGLAGFDPNFVANATAFYNTYHSTSTAKPYTETAYTPDALARVKQVTPEYIGTTPTAFVVHAYGVDVAAKLSHALVTDESGKRTRSYTDVFGNTMRSILGAGAAESTVTQFTYNVLGQRKQATDPRGLITTFTVDTRGLVTSRASPDAGTVNSKYDKGGNVRFTQDANQAAAGRVFFTNYDFANRALVAGEGTAAWAPDPDGAPTALETTQANWLVVRLYDVSLPPAAFPWNLFPVPPSLTNVTGRLAGIASKSNGAWQVTYFSYDADGRGATRYTYTQANGGGSVLTTLNTTVTYTRDLRDGITQRSLTVGTNTFYQWYDYDDRGLLSKVSDSTLANKPTVPSATYLYRSGGELQERQFRGGSSVPLRYTIRGQLEKIGDPSGTSYPFSARYAYQKNGVVDTVEFYSGGSLAAQKRYRYVFGPTGYDALNRLKSADFSSWSGTAWTVTPAHDLANITYDSAGNLRTLQRNRETSTPTWLIDNLTYAYGFAGTNRLSSVTDAISGNAETWDARTGSFTYDPNGNVLTAPAPYSVTSVTYNTENLPLSLTRAGVTTTYRYDDAGQRITKQVGTGSVEIYILDGTTTIGVFTVDGTGTPTSWYFNILAGDNVIGRQPNGGTRSFYHTDLLGSTRAVTLGTTGAVVESYDFEPWGLLMPGRTLAGPTKEGFSGKEHDVETGFDYFGARYYMPALGRWASVDPVGDAFSGWSPYVYTFNNPLRLTDPDGRCPPKWLCNVLGITAGQSATEYYAQIATDPNSSGLEKVAATAGGLFSALWTPDTYVATATTLVGAVAGPLTDGAVSTAGDIVTGNFSLSGTAMNFLPGPGGNKIDDGIDAARTTTKSLAPDAAQAGRRLPDSEIAAPPAKRGQAPTGSDGHPVELHHRGQNPAGPLDEMTRTEHRGQGNFKRNHPNTGQQRSRIDRKKAAKEQRQHWCQQWDNGRFKRC